MPHCLHPISEGGDTITPISPLLLQTPSSVHVHLPLDLCVPATASLMSLLAGLSPAHISALLIFHLTDKCPDRQWGTQGPFP